MQPSPPKICYIDLTMSCTNSDALLTFSSVHSVARVARYSIMRLNVTMCSLLSCVHFIAVKQTRVGLCLHKHTTIIMSCENVHHTMMD